MGKKGGVVGFGGRGEAFPQTEDSIDDPCPYRMQACAHQTLP